MEKIVIYQIYSIFSKIKKNRNIETHENYILYEKNIKRLIKKELNKKNIKKTFRFMKYFLNKNTLYIEKKKYIIIHV